MTNPPEFILFALVMTGRRADNGRAEHVVAFNKGRQLLLAPALGPGRSRGEHHVAKVSCAVVDPDAHRVIEGSAKLCKDFAWLAYRS